MSNEKEIIELLEDIKKSMRSIDARQETNEVFSDSNKLLAQVEERSEHFTRQIQSTFDRIHDKVFNFNNIMIGAYLVLATFPSDNPKMPLWTIVFPILNLIYLIIIEVRQMEIHRFAANQKNWTSDDNYEYDKKIDKQTYLSLFALALSLGCLIYIILCLFR